MRRITKRRSSAFVLLACALFVVSVVFIYIPATTKEAHALPNGVIQSGYAECINQTHYFYGYNDFSCTATLPNPVAVNDTLVVGVAMNNYTEYGNVDCFGISECYVASPLNDGVLGTFFGAYYNSIAAYGSDDFNQGMFTDIGYVQVVSSSMATYFNSNGMFMDMGIGNSEQLQYMFVSVYEVQGLNTTNSFGQINSNYGSTYNTIQYLNDNSSKGLFFGTTENQYDYGMTPGSQFGVVGSNAISQNLTLTDVVGCSGVYPVCTLVNVNGTISGGSNWSEAVAGFGLNGVASTVTQPINLTEVAGGTTPTFTLTRCSPSPAMVVGDGTTHDINATEGCPLVVHVPSDGNDSRVRFAGGALTVTVNTCASGTCTEADISYYLEWNNTVKASPNPGGQLWSSGLSIAVNGTLAGTPDTTLGVIDPPSGSSSDGVTNVWSDSGQVVYVFSPAGGSPGGERWEGRGTTTFTPTSGLNVYTAAFYHQFELTVTGGNGITYSTPSPTLDAFWDVGTSLTVTSNGVWGRSGGSGDRVTQYQVDSGAHVPEATTGTITTTSITMNATHSVTFTDLAQFELTLSATTGGTASYVTSPTITADTGWYDTGTSVTFSASPSGGYTFVAWTGTGACSYSGGANPHSITLTCAATEHASFTTASAVTVRLQLDGHVAGGVGLFGLSGCDVSVITINSDNTTYSFTSDASCSIMITAPSDYVSGGVDSARARFAGGAASLNFTSCSSGTCSVVFFPYYYQYYFTFYIQAKAPTTFDPGLSFSVTGLSFDIPSTALCTITSSAATTDYCHAWMDANVSPAIYPPGYIGYPAQVTISSGVVWGTNGNSFGVAAQANFTRNTYSDISFGYWEQLTNTYVANPSVPSTFTGSISFAVTGTEFGASSSPVCTISVPASPASGPYGCTGYADEDLPVMLPSFSGGNPLHIRWQVSGTRSFNDSTAGNTHSTNYYEQLQNAYNVFAQPSISFVSGLTFTLTGTIGGSPGTVCAMSPTNESDTCVAWADYDTAVTFPPTPTGAAVKTEWVAVGALIFTDNTGGNTHRVDYYGQVYVGWTAHPSSPSMWDGLYKLVVSGWQLGSVVDVCTMTTSSGGGDVSCSGYVEIAVGDSIDNTTFLAPSPYTWNAQVPFGFDDYIPANHTIDFVRTDLVTIAIEATLVPYSDAGLLPTDVSVVGCAASPDSLFGDSMTVDVSVQASCSVTLELEAGAWHFISSESKYLVFTSCRTGTCSMLSESYTADLVTIPVLPTLASAGTVQDIMVSVKPNGGDALCAAYDGPSNFLGDGTTHYITVGYACPVVFTINNVGYYWTWNYVAAFQVLSCYWEGSSVGPVICPAQNMNYVEGGESPSVGASIQSDTYAYCYSCLSTDAHTTVTAAGDQLLVLVHMVYTNPYQIGGGITSPTCVISDTLGTNITQVYGTPCSEAVSIFGSGVEDWIFTSGEVPSPGLDTITLQLTAGFCFFCGMGGVTTDAGIFANVTIAVYAISSGPVGLDLPGGGGGGGPGGGLSVGEYTPCSVMSSRCYTNIATEVIVTTIGYVAQANDGEGMGVYTAGADYTLADNQTEPGVYYNAGWGTSEYDVLTTNSTWPGITSPETIGAAPGGWTELSVDWVTQTPSGPVIVYIVIPPNPGTVGFWFFPLLIILFFALWFLFQAGHNGASTWARNYMFLTGLVVGSIVAMQLEVLEGVILLLVLIFWIFYAFRG